MFLILLAILGGFATASCSKEKVGVMQKEAIRKTTAEMENDSLHASISEIYCAILNNDSDYIRARPMICIHDDFLEFSEKSDSLFFIKEIRESVDGISDETINSFLENKRQMGILQTRFDLKFKYIFYLANNEGLPVFSWTLKEGKRGQRPEYIRFSRVGINMARTQALVRTEITDGRFGYGKGTYFLIKSDSGWVKRYGKKWYAM